VSAVKSRLHRARYTVRAALAPFVAARPDLGIGGAGLETAWSRLAGVPASAVLAPV